MKKLQIFSNMKNKTYIYYALAAALAIYYFTKMKKVTGIKEDAQALSKKQAAQLKFSIDRETMEDIYREQQYQY